MPAMLRPLYPGAYQIASRFGERDLFQYLFVGERVVLLDSGLSRTPEHAIFPSLEKLGLSPQRLTVAITSHPDLDHQGGNAALRAAHRQVVLACHEADRAMIEDPATLFALRYEHLRTEQGLGLDGLAPDLAGRPAAVDAILRDGERLRLAEDWELEVWHVPGHAPGHLALYDPRQGALFSSDAVQGQGCPTAGGRMAFGPTYYDPEAYLATIARLERQPIQHLYSGHWPEAHGAQVAAFLRESRLFPLRAEALLAADLAAAGRHGATLDALLERLGPQLGDWPSAQHRMLMFALHGHLELLERRGRVRRIGRAPRVAWQWSGDGAQPEGKGAWQA
jgi:glyoxylase-like metal-dependent hydrolase (beta-lactamase superfamily II)